MARGQLILEGCRVQPLRDGQTYSVKREGESLPLFPFSITHPDSSQAYHLATTSEQETDEWMRALRVSSPLDKRCCACGCAFGCGVKSAAAHSPRSTDTPQSAAAGPRRVSLRRKTSVDARLLQQQQQFQQQQSAAAEAALGGSSGGGSRSSSFGHPLPEAGGLNTSQRGLQGNPALVPPELAGKVCRAMRSLLGDTETTEGWEPAPSKHDVQVRFFQRGSSVSVSLPLQRTRFNPPSLTLLPHTHQPPSLRPPLPPPKKSCTAGPA